MAPKLLFTIRNFEQPDVLSGELEAIFIKKVNLFTFVISRYPNS
jgi:hypothetical protein